MPILRDLFGKLEDGINDMRRSRDERLEEASRVISELMLDTAREFAPDGSKNLDQYPTRFGQRPSERMGETPIKESLTMEAGIVLSSKMVGESMITMNTSAFHTIFFTEGIPKRYVGGTGQRRTPASGNMYQNSSSSRTGKPYPLTFHNNRTGENVKCWTFVNNGAIKLDELDYGDFLVRAYEENRDEIQEIVEDAAEATFGDTLRGIFR